MKWRAYFVDGPAKGQMHPIPSADHSFWLQGADQDGKWRQTKYRRLDLDKVTRTARYELEEQS